MHQILRLFSFKGWPNIIKKDFNKQTERKENEIIMKQVEIVYSINRKVKEVFFNSKNWKSWQFW
jgi:hypothetical protein